MYLVKLWLAQVGLSRSKKPNATGEEQIKRLIEMSLKEAHLARDLPAFNLLASDVWNILHHLFLSAQTLHIDEHPDA